MIEDEYLKTNIVFSNWHIRHLQKDYRSYGTSPGCFIHSNLRANVFVLKIQNKNFDSFLYGKFNFTEESVGSFLQQFL